MSDKKPYIVQDGKAFVRCSGNTFLCIGTVKEAAGVENDPVRFGKMIMNALAYGEYNSINTAQGHMKH